MEWRQLRRRETVAYILQQRVPPAMAQFVAQQLTHIHGCDSSRSGGKVSGEITSPKLVNTVRYHGNKEITSKIPTSTGFAVNCKGARRSGAKRSARLISSERHREISSPSGEKSRDRTSSLPSVLKAWRCRRGITFLHA